MSIQKTENILAPRKSVEAALSHTSAQQVKEFFRTDRAAFQHRRDHGEIRQHGTVRQSNFIQRETVQFHLYVVACC